MLIGLGGWWAVGLSAGRPDRQGPDERAMPGPRSWKASLGEDTQSGQINFTARRDNVIGVRLEMSGLRRERGSVLLLLAARG